MRRRTRRRRKQRGGAHHENETVVETEGSKEVPAAPVLKYPDNVLPGMPTIKPRGQMPFEPHGGHATGDWRTAGGSRRRRKRGRKRRRKRRRRTPRRKRRRKTRKRKYR